MQQVSKVILFLREGKFAARAQIRRVKKDTLLTSCIHFFFMDQRLMQKKIYYTIPFLLNKS
jgi:hypothetical protein